MSKLKRSLVLLVPTILVAWFVWQGAEQSKPETAALAVPKSAVPITPKVVPSAPTSILPNANASSQATLGLANEGVSIVDSPLSPIEQIRAIQDKTDFHQALLKDHDTFARYPTFNKRFEESSKDPVLARYEVYERATEAEDHKSTLTIWSDKKFYLPNETVTVFARMENEYGETIKTRFAGQVIFDETRNLGPVSFVASANNGPAQGQIDMSTGRFDEGIYKVLIVNQFNELADAVTFTVSKPMAQLTGNFREQLNANGDLLIDAHVKVEQSNRYYLEASLYSSTNDAIGTTQYAAQLEVGEHWIPLEFYGLMIRDAGEPGPYLLKHISLAKVAMPIQRAPLQDLEFYTQAYTLDELGSEPYKDQQDRFASSGNQ